MGNIAFGIDLGVVGVSVISLDAEHLREGGLDVVVVIKEIARETIDDEVQKGGDDATDDEHRAKLRGKVAREEAGKLIIARIKEQVPEGDVVFLTGDFNANWDNPILDPIRAELAECRETALVTDKEGINTYNAWGEKNAPLGADVIDRGVTAERYEVLNGDYGVPFISDHWPVMGTFRF